MIMDLKQKLGHQIFSLDKTIYCLNPAIKNVYVRRQPVKFSSFFKEVAFKTSFISKTTALDFSRIPGGENADLVHQTSQ